MTKPCTVRKAETGTKNIRHSSCVIEDFVTDTVTIAVVIYAGSFDCFHSAEFRSAFLCPAENERAWAFHLTTVSSYILWPNDLFYVFP